MGFDSSQVTVDGDERLGCFYGCFLCFSAGGPARGRPFIVSRHKLANLEIVVTIFEVQFEEDAKWVPLNGSHYMGDAKWVMLNWVPLNGAH